jgi:4a-hydroxytetrahydrobiopterin dehydratase
MTELAAKSCTPCRGGVPPLARAAAEGFLAEVLDWSLEDQGRRIERSFRFRNFRQAFAFVGKVAELAEAEGHHPDVSFGWGYARVTLYTHKIRGLHENDFIMAAKIDGIAAAGAD